MCFISAFASSHQIRKLNYYDVPLECDRATISADLLIGFLLAEVEYRIHPMHMSNISFCVSVQVQLTVQQCIH